MVKQGNSNSKTLNIWAFHWFYITLSGTPVVVLTATALRRLTACVPTRADTMLTTGHRPQLRPPVGPGRNTITALST